MFQALTLKTREESENNKRGHILMISACFSKLINQMKKAESSQMEDVLKVLCCDMCFKFLKNTCERAHFLV